MASNPRVGQQCCAGGRLHTQRFAPAPVPICMCVCEGVCVQPLNGSKQKDIYVFVCFVVAYTHVSILHCCRQVKEAIPVPLTGLQDALRSSQARGLASQLPRPEVLLQRWACRLHMPTAVCPTLLQAKGPARQLQGSTLLQKGACQPHTRTAVWPAHFWQG